MSHLKRLLNGCMRQVTRLAMMLVIKRNARSSCEVQDPWSDAELAAFVRVISSGLYDRSEDLSRLVSQIAARSKAGKNENKTSETA